MQRRMTLSVALLLASCGEAAKKRDAAPEPRRESDAAMRAKAAVEEAQRRRVNDSHVSELAGSLRRNASSSSGDRSSPST